MKTSNDRFQIGGLAKAAEATVGTIKINTIEEVSDHGRPAVRKTRHAHSALVAAAANLYFRMTGIPIRFQSSTADWQRWETECFLMLNGDRFHAVAEGAGSVCVDRLPGENLFEEMLDGRLTSAMLEAAAREFRRAHSLWNDELGGYWSHGDATMSNVIYDAAEDRARLIDFEIVHVPSLSARARHADDLLVFLLDMIGHVERGKWRPLALAFLDAYDNPAVIRELRRHLVIPGGLARIWWKVRTNFADNKKVRRRLDALSRALENPRPHHFVAARLPARGGGLRSPARRSARECRAQARAHARSAKGRAQFRRGCRAGCR